MRNLDSMGRGVGRESCAARAQEAGRHAGNNFGRPVSMTVAMKDRKGAKIRRDFKD